MNIIVAMTRNRVIGKDNKLIWHISEDLRNFRELTSGCVIVMGRKTYESIGRPLPNRMNIVVSSSIGETKGLVVCRSVEEALKKADTFKKEVFVIGGSSVYEQALPFAKKLYISWVKKEYEGDAHFPKFNESEWVIVEKKDYDEFEFVVYEKK